MTFTMTMTLTDTIDNYMYHILFIPKVCIHLERLKTGREQPSTSLSGGEQVTDTILVTMTQLTPLVHIKSKNLRTFE
jgi:hypothetical protein